MDLQQINNVAVNSLNSSDLSNVRKLDIAQNINSSSTKNIELNISDNQNLFRSDLSSKLNLHINNISTTSILKVDLSSQINTLNNIQSNIDNYKSGVTTVQDAQANVAELMNSYNYGTSAIEEKLKKLEDLKGTSTTYFDGKAGAIPQGVDMLEQDIVKKKTQMHTTLEKVAQMNETFKKQAQGVIAQEVSQHKIESPFKNVDFSKFEPKSLSTIAGSATFTQANATSSSNIQLLS